MIRTLFIVCFFFLESGFGQTKYVVTVPTTDGVLLDATYYVPSAPQPKKGYPAIIFIHGFAFSKDETDASARIYAQLGYVTFTYSVRGHGNSTGLSTIMSTAERNDLATIVNYVRNLPRVDARSVGITGGSQGGLHGLWAAADRLPVKAITADVIGPSWASDVLANGCYRSTLMYLLSANTVRYDPIRDSLFNYLLVDDYDGFYNKFVPSRDIDRKAFTLSRTPLMLFGKWQDHYFRANEGINGYSIYRAKKDAEKLYVGTGGHYSDDVWPEWNYQFGWITRWFNEFLKGQRTNFLKEPDITYAYSSLPMDTSGYFTWTERTLNTWPPPGITPVRFYLKSDGSASYSPPAASSASRMLLNDYRDSTYTFYWAFWDDFQGDWFDSSFHQQSLVFQTTPLGKTVDWVGVPKMHLYVNSDGDKFPVNAQVYEVDPSGKKYFVNRINYEARKNQPGTLRVIDAEGNAHAHQFKIGNSIRIELTNLDMTNRKLLGYYPFVVPVFQRSQTWISMEASHPSYIELPLLTGSLPKSVVLESNDVPEKFNLAQNYPNPFNPTTDIEYAVLTAGHVSLKIFDVLGREITSLVDDVQQAGSYKATFNASNLASGIYFYRLITNETVQTKKMMLLK
jgi:predicted acyl esterase